MHERVLYNYFSERVSVLPRVKSVAPSGKIGGARSVRPEKIGPRFLHNYRDEWAPTGKIGGSRNVGPETVAPRLPHTQIGRGLGQN